MTSATRAAGVGLLAGVASGVYLYGRYLKACRTHVVRQADEAWASGAMEQMDQAAAELESFLQDLPEEETEVAEVPEFDWIRDMPTPPPTPSDGTLPPLPQKKKGLSRRMCINRSGAAVAVALRVRAKLGEIPSPSSSNKQMVAKLCCDVLATYNVRAADVVHVVPLAVVMVFCPTGTDIMAARVLSTREIGERLQQHRARYGPSMLRRILDWVEGVEDRPTLEFGQH